MKHDIVLKLRTCCDSPSSNCKSCCRKSWLTSRPCGTWWVLSCSHSLTGMLPSGTRLMSTSWSRRPRNSPRISSSSIRLCATMRCTGVLLASNPQVYASCSAQVTAVPCLRFGCIESDICCETSCVESHTSQHVILHAQKVFMIQI